MSEEEEEEVLQKLESLEDILTRLDSHKISKEVKAEVISVIGISKELLEKVRDEKEKERLRIEAEGPPLRGIELQNQKLRIEMELHRKIDEVRHLASQNKNLQEDIMINRINTMNLHQFFEEKAKKAEKRVLDLSQELVRSQEMSKRYLTQREQLLNQMQSSDHSNLSDAERNQLQYLINDAEVMKREITQLRLENTNLMKKVKRSDEDKHNALNMYSTSEVAREEMKKKIEKLEKEIKQLKQTLTNSAADWVNKRRELTQMKEEMKWKMINPNKPPVNQGSLSSLPKSIYTPKRIITPRSLSVLAHRY